MTVKLKSSIRISDQGTLFDPETGDTFTLNETGLKILRFLEQGFDTSQILNELQQEYELTQSVYDRMMLDFKHLLKAFYLLENE